MVFIIINQGNGVYHYKCSSWHLPHLSKPRNVAGSQDGRLSSHFELKSKCQKQSLGQDVVWTCLV